MFIYLEELDLDLALELELEPVLRFLRPSFFNGPLAARLSITAYFGFINSTILRIFAMISITIKNHNK